MTIKRMDNVGIVVDDLAAAIAFFVELDLELEGETTVEGHWVDRRRRARRRPIRYGCGSSPTSQKPRRSIT